jgi:hypothetical protein
MRICRTVKIRLFVAALIVMGLGGCADSHSTVTVTAREHTTGGEGVHVGGTATRPVERRRPSPSTLPLLKGFIRCDAQIEAKAADTTCAFAENTFYAYWHSKGAQTLTAYSPAAGRNFALRCTPSASQVACISSDQAVVRFSQSSIDQYTVAQAHAYAVSHQLGPETASTGTPSGAGTSGSGAATQTSTSSGDFCSSHDCIPNYPNGRGTTVQCADGTYSDSGGIRGACSHHGGVG